MTSQQKALKLARKQYGTTAYTEDTINYRRVGYRCNNGNFLNGIGDTWHDAFVSLAVQTNTLQEKGVI